MQIHWIGTEGRGWNWGVAIHVFNFIVRFRVLSWLPLIRFTIRRAHLNEWGLPYEERVEGITLPSDAPHTPENPGAEFWSAFDLRIRRKHGLPVRADHVR